MSYRKTQEVIGSLDMSLSGTGMTIIDSHGKILCQELLSSKKMKTKQHNNQTKLQIVDGENNLISESFIPSSDLLDMRRIAFFKERIESQFKKYKVTKVIIENFSYGSTGRSTLDLAQLGGVIRYMMYENNIPYFLCPPRNAKAYITGFSKAEKEQIQGSIMERFGIMIDDDNIADSFMMAQMLLDFGDGISQYVKEGGIDLLKNHKVVEIRLTTKDKIHAFRKILSIGKASDDDLKRAMDQVNSKNIEKVAEALKLLPDDLKSYLAKPNIKKLNEKYRYKEVKKSKKSKTEAQATI